MKLTVDGIRAALLYGKRIFDLPLRVTFYGRVSTDEDRQLDSLSHQSAYFESKIKGCPNWTYVPGYLDEGITGTRTDKRSQFLNMVCDAEAGRFDLILTKEVSRFARDIVDCVQTVRALLKYEVGVLFEDINLNTMEADAEFRLSIMAIVAQEESRKTSERVRFGYRQTMKQGKRHGSAPPIGYRFREDNNGYSVDEGKCGAVEYVFSEYAKGEKGLRTLSRELSERGFYNAVGKPYPCSTLERMIRNPVYRGYIVNGKSHKPSYREDRKVRNPRAEWLLHYDPERVPPLVSDAVWEAANSVLDARGSRMDGIDCSSLDAFGNGRYAYSARILCAEHNCGYHRGVSRWTVGGEARRRELWRCSMYKQYGRKGCDAPVLHKDELDGIMRALFSPLIPLLKALLDPLSEALSATRRGQDRSRLSERELCALAQRKQKLLDGWLRGVLSDADYRTATEQIEAQLTERTRQTSEPADAPDASAILRRASENAELASSEILDALVRRLIERIVIRRTPSACQMEITLYASERPIVLDLSLCLRRQSSARACATSPSATPCPTTASAQPSPTSAPRRSRTGR